MYTFYTQFIGFCYQKWSGHAMSEEELCQKLVQLSFTKIAISKRQRGGAKLFKNLLILHLIQEIRRRSN